MGNWIGKTDEKISRFLHLFVFIHLPDAFIQSDTEFSVYFLSSCIHSLGFWTHDLGTHG